MKIQAQIPLATLIALLILITFSACTSTSDLVLETDRQSVQTGLYNLQVRVVGKQELRDQAGSTKSPFVNTPRAFDPRQYIVFELVVNNKSDRPVFFELKDLELKMGADNYGTKNSFQIMQYWEKEDDIKSAELTRMERMLDRYMLPRDVSIPAGGLKRGYIVFLANIGKYGEMNMVLPLFSGSARPDIFEFVFGYTNY